MTYVETRSPPPPCAQYGWKKAHVGGPLRRARARAATPTHTRVATTTATQAKAVNRPTAPIAHISGLGKPAANEASLGCNPEPDLRPPTALHDRSAKLRSHLPIPAGLYELLRSTKTRNEQRSAIRIILTVANLPSKESFRKADILCGDVRPDFSVCFSTKSG